MCVYMCVCVFAYSVCGVFTLVCVCVSMWCVHIVIDGDVTEPSVSDDVTECGVNDGDVGECGVSDGDVIERSVSDGDVVVHGITDVDITDVTLVLMFLSGVPLMVMSLSGMMCDRLWQSLMRLGSCCKSSTPGSQCRSGQKKKYRLWR